MQVAELVDGLLHHALGAVPVGDVVAVHDRFATHRLDVGNGLHRGARVTALAVHVTTEVVHDDLGALTREQQRVLASQPAPGARDDRNASLECTHDDLPSLDGEAS